MKNKTDWMDRLLDYPLSGNNWTVAASVVIFITACIMLFIQGL